MLNFKRTTMKKMKFYFMTFLALGTLASCTGDLDIVPADDNTFTAEEFYAQPNAYRMALAGVYGNLSMPGVSGAVSSSLSGVDAGTSQYGRCLWYLQDLSTDEAIWSYENDPGAKDLQRNTWNASNPLILGMFSRAMVGVAICNEFLRQSTPEKLSGRGVTDATLLADIATFREETRVIRAMYYYNMMDLFGKAPFYDESSALNSQGPEMSRAELFEYIENELNAVMPNLKPARTNEYGRVDQGVAHMLLAKIYLNAEVYLGTPRYDDCVTELNQIIGSGYTLNPEYLNNFKSDNNISPEMIFTLQSDGNLTQNYGPTTVMTNGQVGSIEANGLAVGVASGGWGGALRLRKQFVQKFDGSDFDNDERNTILPPGIRPIDITVVTDQKQGYILQKYSNISSTGVVGPNSTFVNTDFPLFRLADAYLMYAECAVRGAAGATTGQATTYINELRERANNGSTSANIAEGNLNLDFILDERARELYWEGHRRQDLIRFNKYTGGAYNWAWKGGGQNGLALTPDKKLFPIPTASLAANANLTQNPGY
jgi:hypothetical protein